MFTFQQQFLKSVVCTLTLIFFTSLVFAPEAQARRLGGGSSVGKSSTGMFNKSAPPPAKQSATQTSSTQPNMAPPAKKPLMGMLGGLAAGLGLAALFSMLGFGDELASMLGTFLIIAAVAMLGLFLFRMFKKQRQPAYAGHATGDTLNQRQHFEYQAPVRESTGTGTSAATTATPANHAFGNAQQQGQSLGHALPAHFDQTKFLDNAKQFFIMIQKEFDAGNLEQLKQYCSDDVVDYARQEIQQRGNTVNVTQVVSLQANIVGYDASYTEEEVTVEFNALLREEKDAPPIEVTEHWVLSRTKQNGGWLLAGVHTVGVGSV